MKLLIIKIILGICAVTVISVVTYMYFQYQHIKKDPEQLIKSENALLLSKINQLVVIPSDEQPTIADILDKTKIADQPFFTSAENGDKLLIYGKSGVTILYRPALNKIVTMGSLQAEQSEELASAETEVITIAVFNGTSVAGAAENYKKKVQTELALPVLEVMTGNAVKHDYSATTIIKLSDKVDDAATQKIAETLGITVGTLPKEEKKPAADLLIILGNK